MLRKGRRSRGRHPTAEAASRGLASRLMVLAIVSWIMAAPAARAAEDEIHILFSYGSEKETWVKQATDAFHKSGIRLDTGERIVVDARPGGSNVLITEALEGKTKAHLISPASQIFLVIANGKATEELGQPPLVNLAETKELVRSPLVVAMWTEMATKIGWDTKPPGWRDVFKFVAEPGAWDRYRTPRWGSFKYGHTHPEYSNSGLLALVAEVYAGLNKYDPDKIGSRDMNSPALIAYLRQVEGGVIHYGESTGFFAKKMFDPKIGGPQFLSASILYENLVFEANKKAQVANPTAYSGPKVMAIYPAEGTFSNEHPVGVVERPWVDDKHRAAAKKYIEFLRSDEWQRRARDLGFRPAVKGIPTDDVLKPEYGVDARQFRDDQALKSPSYQVVKRAQVLWRQAKRPADIVLAIDTSGSMKEQVKFIDPETGKPRTETKIKLAEDAAKEFVDQLSDGDNLTVILFDTETQFLLSRDNPTRTMDDKGKLEVKHELTDLPAGGMTALYDVTEMAYDLLNGRGSRGNRGIVVLSDGRHEKGEAEAEKAKKKEKMLKKIYNDGEKNIFTFTIGYGDPGDPRALLDVETLKAIADESKGRYAPADPSTIRKVLREIVTFF